MASQRVTILRGRTGMHRPNRAVGLRHHPVVAELEWERRD